MAGAPEGAWIGPFAAVDSRRQRAPAATRVPRSVALAAIGVTLLGSCTSVVNGNGVFDSLTLDRPAFHGVSVDNGISAAVSFGGSAQTVVLSGDQNVIHDYIDVSVVDGILRVRVTGVDSVTYGIPPRLEITLPAGAVFDVADASGYGHIDVYGAQTSTLTVDATDATVTLAGGVAGGGSSTLLDVSLVRSGLRAVQHRADAASVTASDSTAELWVQPNGSVTGTASGTSALDVCGGGTCDVQLSGSATCDPLSNSDAICMQ